MKLMLWTAAIVASIGGRLGFTLCEHWTWETHTPPRQPRSRWGRLYRAGLRERRPPLRRKFSVPGSVRLEDHAPGPLSAPSRRP